MVVQTENHIFCVLLSHERHMSDTFFVLFLQINRFLMALHKYELGYSQISENTLVLFQVT